MDAKADTSGLRRKIDALGARAEPAAQAVLLSGADSFVGFMDKFAKRDTGRYVRGWVEAGNMLPIPSRPLPALKAGRWEQRIRGALESQIERLANKLASIEKTLDNWYYSKGRPLGSWGRARQAEANQLRRRLERAVGEYQKFLGAEGPVIAFDVFSNGRTRVTKEGVRRRLRLTTVRDQVYGGVGKVMIRDGEVVVVLHNREPHATLVERRYRFVSRALGQVRAETDSRGRKIATRTLGAA